MGSAEWGGWVGGCVDGRHARRRASCAVGVQAGGRATFEARVPQPQSWMELALPLPAPPRARNRAQPEAVRLARTPAP